MAYEDDEYARRVLARQEADRKEWMSLPESVRRAKRAALAREADPNYWGNLSKFAVLGLGVLAFWHWASTPADKIKGVAGDVSGQRTVNIHGRSWSVSAMPEGEFIHFYVSNFQGPVLSFRQRGLDKNSRKLVFRYTGVGMSMVTQAMTDFGVR